MRALPVSRTSRQMSDTALQPEAGLHRSRSHAVRLGAAAGVRRLCRGKCWLGEPPTHRRSHRFHSAMLPIQACALTHARNNATQRTHGKLMQNFQAVRRNAASQVIGAGAGPLPGVAAVVPGVGVGAAATAAAAAGIARGDAQRRTLARAAVATLVTAVAFSIAAAVVENARDIDTCDSDHAYFGIWTSVMLVRLYLASALAAATYKAYVPTSELQPPSVQRLVRLREMLSWFGLAWFIVGNTYIGRAGPVCTATPLYKLAFAMLILQYIQLLFPIVVLVLLVAAVCCCMPFLIRILVATGAVASAQHPATARQIRSLPEEKFHAGRFPSGDASCAICTEEYAENDAIRVLPCGGSHHFHKACVDNWLQINANCPICRGNVLPGIGPPAPAPAAASTSASGSNGGSGGGGDGGSSGGDGGPSAALAAGSVGGDAGATVPSSAGATGARDGRVARTDTDGSGSHEHVAITVDGTVGGGGGGSSGSNLSMGRPVSLVLDRGGLSPLARGGDRDRARLTDLDRSRDRSNSARGDRADEPLVRGAGAAGSGSGPWL